MTRVLNRLSDRKVRTAKAGMWCDGGGLYLQVSNGKSGACRSWIFRFATNGRGRQMGLGPFHTIGLGQAREKARECRRLLLEGIDPIEARRTRRAQAQLAAAKTRALMNAQQRISQPTAPVGRI